MTINFNRVWASSQNPAYPTDAQTARGLSFLGTEEPTFDLHDAMFQALDIKALWLYDQVRLACERFGQNVDGSLGSGARDTMANAITNALLVQRKADEGGHGIVKMANADTVRAGKEFNQAVSPAHLAEYVAEQNTWANTRDKPQTATRWPKFDEVTDKPSLGSASAYDEKYFEKAGTSEALKESLRSGAYCSVYDNGSALYPDLPQGNNILATAGTVRSVVSRVNDSISSIGKSGLFHDALEIPDWIKQQKFDANGSLILTSSNGTSIRLTIFGYIDIYNNSGEKVWTINPLGVLEMGVVPVERVSGIGTAATTSLYDVPEASYTDLPQGGDKSISPGTVRSVVSKLRGELGSSAFTEIYDNGSASYTDLPQGGDKSISPGTVRSAIFNALFSGREFGDVGTYCYAKNMSITSEISPNQVVDGSNLAPSSADQAHGERLSGRWRCMGGSRGCDQPNGFFMTTLYTRVS